MLHTVLAVSILAATIAVVVWRPRGLGVGWPAVIGALLSLAVGTVRVTDLPEVVGIVGDATIAFVAIVLISLVLDRAGTFAWAALHVARWGGGSPWRLFVLVVLLGAVTSALFANDGAALILTPIVVGIVAELRLGARATLAFVMACGFIADTGSVPLTISNLVNIIVADAFDLDFLAYAAVMAPVGVVSVLASLATLALYYRRALPGRYETGDLRSPADAVVDPLTFRAGFAVLALLLVGYALAGPLGLSLGTVACAGAVVLLALALLGRRISVPAVVREAPWQIIVFSAGMYVVVLGLREQGVTALVADLFTWLGGHGLLVTALGVGVVVALLSSVINNLPATLVAVLAIDAAAPSGVLREAMVHASVVGADLGPKLTPIGSLATLLWLEVLAAKGIRITWGQYLRTGIVLTTPVLVLSLAALAGVIALQGASA